jgi:hypothetical protein
MSDTIKIGGISTTAPLMPTYYTSNNPVRPQVEGIGSITPAGVVPYNPTINNGKVLSKKLINVNSTIIVDGLPMPNVNIWIENVHKFTTGDDGSFYLKSVPENATIKASMVGFKDIELDAMIFPAQATLVFTAESLNNVDVVKKNKSNSWLWIIAVLGLVYGGYRYSVNSKNNKIVKTKI